MGNKQKIAILLLSWLVLLTACTREVSFDQQVHPILKVNCLACHEEGGEGFIASGFSVESYAKIMKGTNFGPVIIPGNHTSSTLVLLIEHKAHPTINMPKGKSPLSDKKIDLIRRWIDQGAKNN